MNQASTTTAVTSSTDPSTANQAVTFTATVSYSGSGTPTGTVAFLDGTTEFSTVLGAASGSGTSQANFTTAALSLGSHGITAVYSGDANYTGSTSGTLTQTVNAPSDIWTVVNTGDAGTGNSATQTGDLGYCLANADAGDTIVFAILDGNGIGSWTRPSRCRAPYPRSAMPSSSTATRRRVPTTRPPAPRPKSTAEVSPAGPWTA